MTNPSEVVVTNMDETAALVALVRCNVPPHIQEVLIYGSKQMQIPPGALLKAMAAVIAKRVPGAGVGQQTGTHAQGWNACRERVLKGE